MFVFKMFEGAEEVHPVDARLLDEGVLRIGRDPAADWVVADPSREISRWHCELHARGGALHIRALGANGVFDSLGSRLPDGEDIAIDVPQMLSFGPYRIRAEHAPQAGSGGMAAGMTLILTPPMGNCVDVPTDWTDGPDQTDSMGESLLDIFCDGAGLNASAFAADDPADVMRQAGAVYRQMLLGVADLMAEREEMRSRYAIAHTTIGGSDNNPFKWAPSQRLATDLLRPPRAGFLGGQEALAASFRDIKKHVIATFGGMQAALRTAVATFGATALDDAKERQGSLLKSRAAFRAEEAERRHALLSRELDGEAEGSLGEAFVSGYHAASNDLGSRGI